MSMERLIYFAPVLGICALLFAFYLTKKVGKQDAGTDRMKEIAAFIHEGARAFLTAEYKILVVFVAVLFLSLIHISIYPDGNPVSTSTSFRYRCSGRNRCKYFRRTIWFCAHIYTVCRI